jgi:hypothetical protein
MALGEKLLRGSSTMQEQIALRKTFSRRNPVLEHNQTDAIFEKFRVKTKLKLKINLIWIGFHIYPMTL